MREQKKRGGGQTNLIVKTALRYDNPNLIFEDFITPFTYNFQPFTFQVSCSLSLQDKLGGIKLESCCPTKHRQTD